jgi:hypothetical protein
LRESFAPPIYPHISHAGAPILRGIIRCKVR